MSLSKSAALIFRSAMSASGLFGQHGVGRQIAWRGGFDETGVAATRPDALRAATPAADRHRFDRHVGVVSPGDDERQCNDQHRGEEMPSQGSNPEIGIS